MPPNKEWTSCSRLDPRTGASAGCAYGREETALDRYVAAFDPTYNYDLVNTALGDGVIASVLEMTSQQWQTAAEVDRPIWKH
jgi:hypothetical protein